MVNTRWRNKVDSTFSGTLLEPTLDVGTNVVNGSGITQHGYIK